MLRTSSLPKVARLWGAWSAILPSADTTASRSWFRAVCEPSPRRFCLTLAGVFGAAIVATIATNLLVDPFAQYGSGLLPPVTKTSREEKLALLSANGPPDALLLGSSRVMKFEPAYLSARTGWKTFNASVYYGRPEDHLALLRASVRQFGCWPKAVIVGVDIDAFVESPGPDARLLRSETLRREVAPLLQWHDRWQPYRELLSWNQTAWSAKSLLRHARGQGALVAEEHFEPLGSIVYDRREQDLAAGTYDLQAAMDYTQREYRRLYRGYRKLSSLRVEAWRELAAECRREQIPLIVFLTTWHPSLHAELASSATFGARRREAIALLRSTLGPRGRLVDFTHLDAFGGDASQFVDGVHPLEANTRRMIDVLFPDVSAESAGGDVAVQ